MNMFTNIRLGEKWLALVQLTSAVNHVYPNLAFEDKTRSLLHGVVLGWTAALPANIKKGL
jgi:hypothetical protein